MEKKFLKNFSLFSLALISSILIGIAMFRFLFCVWHKYSACLCDRFLNLVFDQRPTDQSGSKLVRETSRRAGCILYPNRGIWFGACVDDLLH